jgi:2-keto-4-pentenoate hydratase
MNSDNINAAAKLLVEARQNGVKRAPLPPELQPKSIDEGHAIQDATVALLNETVGGWKVGLDKAGAMSRAPIFKGDIQTNPGRIASSGTNLRGIEAEIAFRFLKDLPARNNDYTRTEVEDAVEAFAAIELLNSRYAEPRPLSTLEKLADRILQGGIVCGTPRADWRTVDWAKLEVVLTVDGTDIATGTGTHPVGDPVAPALALVNNLRKGSGVKAGQIMTTGTWSGVNFVTPDSLAVANFDGFEPVLAQFTA